MQSDFSNRIETSSPGSEGSDRWNSMQPGHWKLVRPDELSRRPIESRTGPTGELPTESSGTPLDLPGMDRPSAQQRDAPRVELNRRQELEHRLKTSPTDLEAFMELGRIYRAENRAIDARRILQQAVEIFPDESNLLWEYEEAILARSLQQLREVAELAQRLNTAETARELQRCQDDWAHRRMEICRARLNRDPSLLHLRIVLAEALHDAGMHQRAIEELEPVLESDELSPSGYLIQGRCFLALGNELEAMASWRSASMRRSVVAPVRLRIAALRLLCATADKLGVTLTLQQYQQHLHLAEQELAKHRSAGRKRGPDRGCASRPTANGLDHFVVS